MKLKNKLFHLALLSLVLIFAGCKKDSDDEPTQPPMPTTFFSGSFISGQNNPETEWTATVVEAVHDTTLGTLTISMTNTIGDQINIFLSDTASKYYQFNKVSNNYSTYVSSSDLGLSISTIGDDAETRKGGLLKIDAYDTATNLLQARTPLTSWVVVDPAGEDQPFGAIRDGVFANIPVRIQ